jgi:nitrite reductase (NADH) large subunit
LETDVIVFSAGIRPRDDLARGSGLTVGERGGIVIDDYCRTSDPNIFAIGECALWRGRLFGLVAPGYDMARVAAQAITGGADVFGGADMSTKLKLLGVAVASIRGIPRRARLFIHRRAPRGLQEAGRHRRRRQAVRRSDGR